MAFDETKPSSARIYDYLIGGTHNFEADRVVGRHIAEKYPFYAQGARLNRWLLSYAAAQLVRSGLNCFIDFATGLPTEGALHEHVPETAKVLYNDYDPEVVAYSREILGNQSNIHYQQARIEHIDHILPAAEHLFGDERRVGMIMIGVVYFIDDESLSRVFQRLYEWSAPGSQIVVTTFVADMNNEAAQETKRLYEQSTGLSLYARSPSELQDLLGPWQPQGNGFQPLEDFAEPVIQNKLVMDHVRGQIGYGGFFTRP